MMGGIRMSIMWTQESLLSHIIVTGKKKNISITQAYKATYGWDMNPIQHQAGQHNNANETCN